MRTFILKLTDSKVLAVCLLVLAVLHQVWRFSMLGGISYDEAIQVAAGRSFWVGSGFSVEYVGLEALNQVQAVWVNQWPPGYGILVVFFSYFVSGIEKANLLLYSLSLAALYIAYYFTLEQFQIFERRWHILFLLLLWVSGQPPVSYISTSETLALAMFSWYVYFLLVALRNPDPMSRHILRLSLLTVGLVFLRYAYWPLCLIAPVCLSIRGRQESKFLYAAIVVSAVAIAAISGLSVVNRAHSGHATFLSSYYGSGMSESQGFYWSNLLLARHEFCQVPFGCAELWSFLQARDCDFWAGLLSLALSILILGCFVATVLRWVPRTLERSLGFSDGPASFWVVGCLTQILTMGALAALSLKTPVYSIPGYADAWTYVWEIRYYAPTWFFFLAAGFGFMVNSPGGLQRTLVRVGLGGVLLFAALAHAKSLLLSRPVGTQEVSPEVRLKKALSSSGRTILVTNHLTTSAYLSGALIVRSFGGADLDPLALGSQSVRLVFAAWSTKHLREKEIDAEKIRHLAERFQAERIYTSSDFGLWSVDTGGRN